MTYIYAREKAARLRRARGIPAHVPTTHIADHIRTLQAAGRSVTGIAAAAQVSPSTIKGILRAARPTVHRRTALAILAVQPADIHTQPGRGVAS